MAEQCKATKGRFPTSTVLNGHRLACQRGAEDEGQEESGSRSRMRRNRFRDSTFVFCVTAGFLGDQGEEQEDDEEDGDEDDDDD
eukprot:8304733-Pyramimonas_sp.AAC.1